MNEIQTDDQLIEAVVTGDIARDDSRIIDRARARPEFAERLRDTLAVDDAMWNAAGRFHQVRAIADDPSPSTAADDAAITYGALLEAAGTAGAAQATRRRRPWRIGLLLAASMAIAVGLTLAIQSMTTDGRGGAVDTRLGHEYRIERIGDAVHFEAPPAPKFGAYVLRVFGTAGGDPVWESESVATADPIGLDAEGRTAWQRGRLAQVVVLRADGRVHDQSPRLPID